jgi:hypothetical protein
VLSPLKFLSLPASMATRGYTHKAANRVLEFLAATFGVEFPSACLAVFLEPRSKCGFHIHRDIGLSIPWFQYPILHVIRSGRWLELERALEVILFHTEEIVWNQHHGEYFFAWLCKQLWHKNLQY